MKEIGGYIEFEHYHYSFFHNGAILLNCGRSCLAYLIEARNIKKILVPKFCCDSVFNLCKKYSVELRFYSIDEKFKPVNIDLQDDEYLYVVNFYGQIDENCLKNLSQKYKHLILDFAQSYFQMPPKNIDTIYTCRKFFGVSDGAILYTNTKLNKTLPLDESYNRMNFLFGRFERTASEFYSEYSANNKIFADESIKRMSILTENILQSLDYDFIKNHRTENFTFLHKELKSVNKLNLSVPEGAFMYPLLIENGAELRKQLQDKKIYIPTLWPNVLEECDEKSLEYEFAKNILPLPVDQRYDKEEMKIIVNEVKKCIS